MKKYLTWIVLFFVVHMQFSYARAQADNLTAQCDALQQEGVTAVRDSIERRIPFEDPMKAMANISCLDAILNTRLSLGMFFDLSSIIDKLIQKACDRVLDAWSPVASRLNNDLGGEIRFPYGVGSASSGVRTSAGGSGGNTFIAQGVPMWLTPARGKSTAAKQSQAPAQEPTTLWSRVRSWLPG